MQNSDFWTRLISLFGSQTSSVVVSTHNSVPSTRIKRLYLFQPSPVILCMQNSDFRTRNTGPKNPPVVFACKTATSGPEWQVSMGPRHDLSFCACTTSCLASELPVSMGPSPHLWLLHAKQRLWTRITNLYVSQRSPVVLCMLYSVICTRIKSLCGTQTSPDVLCMQNNVPSIRITSLYGSQPSSVVFGCKTTSFGP